MVAGDDDTAWLMRGSDVLGEYRSLTPTDLFSFVTWRMTSRADSIVVAPVPARQQVEGDCEVALSPADFAASRDGCQAREPLDLGSCSQWFERYRAAMGEPSYLARSIANGSNRIWAIGGDETSSACEAWEIRAELPPDHGPAPTVVEGWLAITDVEREGYSAGRQRRFTLVHQAASLGHETPWRQVAGEEPSVLVFGCSPHSTRIVDDGERMTVFATGEAWFHSESACREALGEREPVDLGCG